MLGQRRRRLPNIDPSLGKCIVFAVMHLRKFSWPGGPAMYTLWSKNTLAAYFASEQLLYFGFPRSIQ